MVDKLHIPEQMFPDFDLMSFVDSVGTEGKLHDVGGTEDSKHVVVVDIQDFWTWQWQVTCTNKF